jgi:hypothetical protein
MHGVFAGVDLERDSLVRCDARKFRAQFREQGADDEIGRFGVYRTGLELADVEQRVEQLRHRADGLLLLRERFGRTRIGDGATERAVEHREGLQRLAQIVARGRQKAALAGVGALGQLAHRVGGVACDDEFRFDVLAVGDVANRRGDQSPADIFDRAQADLERKFGPVAPLSVQFEPGAHRAESNVVEVVLYVPAVPRAESRRHQHFDALADEFVVGVAEQCGELPIRIPDRAGSVDDDHRVRSRIECAARQFRRSIPHWRTSLLLTHSNRSTPTAAQFVGRESSRDSALRCCESSDRRRRAARIAAPRVITMA